MAGPLFEVDYAAKTDVGVKRSHNQDSFAMQPASDTKHWLACGHVFIVADGMGGHAVGEKASEKAVRDIPLTYIKHVANDGPAKAIVRAFEEANQTIYQIGQNNPEFKGLGTTGTALFLRPEGAWVGHVGDSRIYRLRNGLLQQLTFDHSYVWEFAKRQGIDPDDLGDFRRNVIIRSLGPDDKVEVDIEGPHSTQPGDLFLLCSDGLTNMVQPKELGSILRVLNPNEACEFLIHLANQRGGTDNITCVIVKIPGEKQGNTTTTIPRLASGKLPWPPLALIAAVLLAVAAIGMKAGDIPGAIFPFAVAAVLTLLGILGLVTMAKAAGSEAADGEESDDLHFYKEYPAPVDEEAEGKLIEVQNDIIQEIKANDPGVNWQDFSDKVSRAESETDIFTRFRLRLLAMESLMSTVYKSRHKAEVFRPKWPGPSRPVGQ